MVTQVKANGHCYNIMCASQWLIYQTSLEHVACRFKKCPSEDLRFLRPVPRPHSLILIAALLDYPAGKLLMLGQGRLSAATVSTIGMEH